MRRAEVWTIYGEHIVFNNVSLAGPSSCEKFFCIRRDDRIDYIPSSDIKRIQVVDGDGENRISSRKKKV